MHHSIRTIALSSIVSLGLLSGSTLLAQDSGMSSTQDQGAQAMHHGPMSPDQEMAHLTKALDLTSEQQSQIKPILQDRHDQLMQTHQDASMSRQDKMAKMKTLDETSNTKLKAILNDQQKTKYEKMVADRKQRMQQMRAMHENNSSEQPNAEAQPQ